VNINISTENVDKWKQIINDVDKTNVPSNFIEKVIIHIFSADNDENKQVINAKKLKDEGYNEEEIEEVINETLYELNDWIESVDFILDIEAVIKKVQPETDKLLTKFTSKQ